MYALRPVYNQGKAFAQYLAAWWERNVIADDPDPRYSYLDRLEGLTNRKD